MVEQNKETTIMTTIADDNVEEVDNLRAGEVDVDAYASSLSTAREHEDPQPSHLHHHDHTNPSDAPSLGCITTRNNTAVVDTGDRKHGVAADVVDKSHAQDAQVRSKANMHKVVVSANGSGNRSAGDNNNCSITSTTRDQDARDLEGNALAIAGAPSFIDPYPHSMLNGIMPIPPTSLTRMENRQQRHQDPLPGAYPVVPVGTGPPRPRPFQQQQQLPTSSNASSAQQLRASHSTNPSRRSVRVSLSNVFAAYETGLIHARQVGQQEEEMRQAAVPVPPGQDIETKEETRRRSSDREKRALFYAMAGLAAVLVLTTIMAVVVSRKNRGSSFSSLASSSSNRAEAPSSVHTFAPTQSLVLDLPDYTLEALRADASGTTPQSRAYEWLIKDPNLESYTRDRRIQRYALAVLFYSTNGEEWLSNGAISPTGNNSNHNVARGGHGGRRLIPIPDGPRPYRRHDKDDPCPPPLPPPPGGGSHPPPPMHVGGAPPGCDQLAFSAGGGSHWLDHAVHECTWFNKHIQGGFHVVCNNEDDSYQVLDLHANGLKGTLPPELALLSNLKETNLAQNKLSGSIPTEIGAGWHRIEGLDATGIWVDTDLSGTLPSEIGLWNQTFVKLRVMMNSLFGPLPTELFAMTKLTDLVLAANSFTGACFHPELLTNMQSLENIEILDNRLTGSIPTEIGLIRTMETFNIEQNAFTGTLPSELGLLSNLYFISAGDNYQINGTLPSELGLLSLHTFSVKDTEITGSIPPELGSNDIPFIYLQRTDLTGTIPPLWCNATILYFTCSETLCGCDCPCVAAANQTN